MKIANFHGTGWEGIIEARDKANEWLIENRKSISVVNTTTAMASIGSKDEIYQSYVITIFYEEEKIPRKSP